MVMNNELGITCHSLSEDAVELCNGTVENNKPQQANWSLTHRETMKARGTSHCYDSVQIWSPLSRGNEIRIVIQQDTD
jgi:hypothetical protein